MQVTEAAKSRILDIADSAERTDFSGLRRVATPVTPEVEIPVDPPDVLGTRLDAFITDGNLYLKRGEEIYAVGALSSLPELSGVSVFETAAPKEPHFVEGGSSTMSTGKKVLPHPTALGDALDTGATLRAARETGDLPAEWLVAATKTLHNAEVEDGYYDYRVAVHGAAAEEIVANGNLRGDPAFDSSAELLLLDVYGYAEINANLYALDVASGSARKLGWLDTSDFDEAVTWDGSAVPARLANAVLLPTGPGTWDSGDDLVGFEAIARFQPPTPLDFDAMLEAPASRMPALGTVASALESSPVAGIYAMTAADNGLSIVTDKATYLIEGQLAGAGWTTDVSVDEALRGTTHPRRSLEAWRAAEDQLSDSHFGLSAARPLLWLEETDGTQHVLAFSGNADKPHVLELSHPPLAVRTHSPSA